MTMTVTKYRVSGSSVSFACPQCRAPFKADLDDAGTEHRCACGATMLVPGVPEREAAREVEAWKAEQAREAEAAETVRRQEAEWKAKVDAENARRRRVVLGSGDRAVSVAQGRTLGTALRVVGVILGVLTALPMIVSAIVTAAAKGPFLAAMMAGAGILAGVAVIAVYAWLGLMVGLLAHAVDVLGAIAESGGARDGR